MAPFIDEGGERRTFAVQPSLNAQLLVGSVTVTEKKALPNWREFSALTDMKMTAT